MPLNVYQNGTETVVAESPDDAVAVCAELLGLSVEEWLVGEEPFELLPPEKDVAISYEEKIDVPEFARGACEKRGAVIIASLPASEWVKSGRKHIASTEW